MKLTMKKRFESYAKNYKRRKSWQRVVSMLTCIIVFCTTYALILPAITLSGEATCGMDEHVHSDACYEVIEEQILTCSPVHNHTADCYDEGTLICGCADFVLHTHDKNCFSESGVILCELAKLEEHIHTDDCYTVEEMVEGHLHEDACYSIELGECICGLEEQEGHTHDDACYGEQYLSCQEAEREGHTHEAACYGEATLSCTIEEDDQHTHGEACYTAELLCGETEDPGHSHGDDCYSRDLICGEEEREGHAHTDDCYEEVRTLICELEEDGVITEELVLTCTKPEVTAHTHTDSCYEITKDEDGNEIRTLICTELEVLEHQHSAECIGTVANRGQLLCREEAHVHGLICYADPAADLEYAQLWERTMDSVVLSGDATADLVAIAETQIGYVESVKNYIVLEDGATIKGYTRYGQWNGTPYESWNELFVSFCMHYAEIDERVFFGAEEGTSWSNALMHHAAFVTSKHTPEPGDLILLNVDDTYYIGIVSGIGSDGYVTAIIGDYQNEVVKDTFTPNDPVIAGYVDMRAALAMVLDATPGDDMAAELPSEPVEATDPSEGNTVHEMPHISASIQLVLELEKTDTEAASEEGQLQGGSQNTARYSDSGSIDMTDYITSVTVYHKTTGWGDTWKELVDPNIVKDGDLVRFGISYEIPGGTLSAANNSISYQLPLTSISTANSGNVTNSKGEIVGTYTISQSGLLTITFSDHYVEQNAGGVVIDGTINLDTEVNALQTDSEGNVKLEFSDNEIVEIKVQQTVKDDLTVEKSAGSVNSDGTVTYTITVSSKNGTAEDVVLSDWMNNVTYLSGFNVKKNGEDVTSEVTNPTAGANSIALTLPQMAAGDTYTITYTGIISGITNGTASAGNGVTVTSKDGEGNTLTDSANVRVDYTDNTLAKSGMVTSDGKVNWTITIGRDGESLKDWVLSDKINGAALQESVTIVYADAYGNSVSVTTNLPFTFPEGAYGPVTVTYTTPLDYNIGANNMSNVATLLPPSGKPVYTGSTNVQDPNQNSGYYPLDKTAGDLTVADDGDGTKSAIIDWTYTINASGGGIYVSDRGDGASYWFFSDYLQNGQYFTDDQWAALCSNLQAAMIAAFNDPAVYNGASWDESNVSQLYSITPTYSGDKIVGYRVEVYENMLKGTKLSYTYQSTGDLGDGTSQKYFQNLANVNDKTWDSASVNYVPVITKLDGTNYSASDSQHAYMDLKNGVISWRIRVSLPADTTNVVITEDLPDNLELSGLTLYFPNYGGSATLNLTGDTTITYGGASYTITTADATASGSTDKKLTITIPDALIAAFGGSSFDILVETKLHEHTSSCSLSCTDGSDDHSHTDSCYSCDQLTAEDIGKSDSGSVEFNNSVSVSYKENGTTDKTAGDSHKQTITNEDTTQQLVKTAGTYENNIIPYTLEINPNGSDLAEGDVLTINDVLYFWKERDKTLLNAALLNVNVAVVNSDGTTTNLSLTDAVDKVDANHFYYTYLQRDSYDENPYNTWYQEFHELEFTVPDNTHLKITYEYLLTGTDLTATTVSNTAYLREVAQHGSSSSSGYYTVQESAATAELKSIYVYKVDADNYANRLPDAKFELYKWDADSEKWVFDHIIESNNSAELELLGLSINQAYYLIEVEAPYGYVLDQTRHYFMLYDSTKSYMTAPEDFPQTAYYTQGRAIYITNEKEGTSVSATKTWQDASGNTIDAPDGSSVDVQLMQVWSRYPSSFDTSTLGTSATVSLAFGEYSSDTSVFGPVSINTHVGDMIYITLRTKDLPTKTNVKVWNETTQQYEWVEQAMDYPAGLMEVTGEANNHLPYTVEGPDESGYYTYTFSYLVTATNRTLRGWVYPENNDATASYSITSYTALAGTNTVESAYGSVVTLSSSNGWNYTWGNLHEYEMDSIGRITGYYSYYVQETAVNGATGYVPSYSTADNGTLVITNKPVTLVVEKQWVDGSGNVIADTSGFDPITFGLYRVTGYNAPDYSTNYGTQIGTYTLSYENGWKYTFDNLPFTGDYVYYTYYVQEIVPGGYEASYSPDGVTFYVSSPSVSSDGSHVYIRNTNNSMSINVEKKWVGTDNVTLPASIPVQLYRWDGTSSTYVGSYEVTGDSWKLTISDLPAQGTDSNGNVVSYSYYVVETVPNGYLASYSSDGTTYGATSNSAMVSQNNGTLYIQNEYVEISLKIEKDWLDRNDAEIQNYAGDAITVKLYRSDGTTTTQIGIYELNSDNNWSYTLPNLPSKGLNSSGQVVNYTYYVEETAQDGYQIRYSVNGTDYSASSPSLGSNGTFYIQNKDITMSLNVEKQWFDASGNTINGTETISFRLYREAGETDILIGTYTLSSDNDWKYTFNDLPSQDADGNPYSYYVVETVPNGYKVTYTLGDSTSDTSPVVSSSGQTLYIKNTQQTVETVTINAEKEWVDQLGNPITGTLPADEVEVELYKWVEGASGGGTEGGTEGDGTEGGGTEGGGTDTETKYTVSGYVSSTSGKQLAELPEQSVAEGTMVIVQYVSFNNGGYYGSVTIDCGNVQTVIKAEDANVKQKIGEQLWGCDMYIFTYYIEVTGNMVIIASTGTPEPQDLYQVPGTDYYVNDAWIYVPDSGVVASDDTTTGAWVSQGTYTLDAANGWQLSIPGLQPGKYKVVEKDSGDQYTVTYTVNGTPYTAEDGFTLDAETGTGKVVITNTVDAKVEIPVNKKWFAPDGVTEITPNGIESITFVVKQNGNQLGDPYTITAADGWATVVKDLPKYDSNDVLYTYTVEEIAVEGYISAETKNADGSWTITNTQNLTSLVVNKTWFAPDGVNTEIPSITSIQFKVLQNSVEYGTYTIASANGWRVEITDLPKYDSNDILYTYTVEEIAVEGYISAETKNADGSWTISNTRNVTSITVNKSWFAPDGTSETPTGITSVQFVLYRVDVNGNRTKVSDTPYTISSDNFWSTTVSDLPIKDENGNAYSYVVEEYGIDGYTSSVTSENGVYTISNTRNETSITVNKVWLREDGTPLEDPPVDSISFRVIQSWTEDGETVSVFYDKDGDGNITEDADDVYTITKDGGWSAVITDLPVKNAGGNMVTYSVKEIPVEHYDSEVTGSGSSWTITNTRKFAITVQKFWQNANGDERPPLVDSIQFNLYQITTENGVEVQTLLPGAPFTITKDNGWQMTFWDLEPGTYRLEEITTDYLKGYVQYDYSSSSGGALGDTATFVGGETDVVMDMTNTPYMNLTVDKTWDGTPMDDLVIELQLYRYKTTVAPTDGPNSFAFTEAVRKSILALEYGQSYEVKTTVDGVETVTGYIELARNYTEVLDASVRWHKTCKNLPIYEVVNGVTYYYTYFLLERTEGYDVTYSTVDESGKYTTIATTGSMTISNEATSIEVTKNWVDKDGNPLTDVPDSIEFYILQNGAVYDPDPTDDVAQPTFTLSAADGWNKVFYGLPIYDENGYRYTYTVQEVDIDGYVSTVTNTVITEVTGEDGETITLENPTYASTITNMDTGSTDISVEKVWDTTADTAVQVQLYRIESTTPPSADAVGEAGTVTEQIWSPELNYAAGSYDINTKTYTYAWNPCIYDQALVTVTTVANDNGTTTYTLHWDAADRWVDGQWISEATGAIVLNVVIPDACYAVGKDNVTNASVSVDNVVMDWPVHYTGADWDTSINAYNNDLKIEWYNSYSDNPVVNNDVVIYNSLDVTFTIPTRSATTDYPEHETNVTSDYLIANNAKVVTNSGTYIPYTADINSGSNLSTDNYTLLSYGNSWQHTWSDLPLYGLDESGNLVYYTYYVLEISDSDSWYPSYSVTDPITSGIIGITNNDTPEYEEPSYELPATGGSGTFPYTLGGIFLLMAGCVVLMYNHKKGRKGVTAP